MIIEPARIQMDYQGKFSRFLVLHLREGETISEIRESPHAFKRVQNDVNRKLLRGDRLSVISDDSLTTAQDRIVTRANVEGVWLGPPARMVSLESEILYEDETFAVRPYGSRYQIIHKRTGAPDGGGVLYDSVKSAEFAIHKRRPKTAA